MRPIRPLVAVVAILALLGAACGDDDTAATDTIAARATTAAGDEPDGPHGDASTTTAARADTTVEAAGPRSVEHARGATQVPADPQRVVALGEEFLLADLLALDVPVVASTATVPDAGFVGVDPARTEGIEPLSATEPDLEGLAALDPDLLVVTAFVWDEVGGELLGRIAPTIAVGGDDWRADVELLGAAFGAETTATGALDAYDRAAADGRAALGGTEVSLATIYPGPSPAAWVDGPSNVPAVLLDLGVTLVPGGDAVADARNGRAFLSLEQLGLLDAPSLVLSQSDLVEGESDAVDAIADTPLWPTLPAVAAGEVVTVDRLGYPGVEGRTRLATELTTLLAG